MKPLYVYDVSYHYDSYDSYDIGIAATLPIAKRLAQTEWTQRELPDVAPTIRWEASHYTWRDEQVKMWRGDTSPYGAGYKIVKVKVTTS